MSITVPAPTMIDRLNAMARRWPKRPAFGEAAMRLFDAQDRSNREFREAYAAAERLLEQHADEYKIAGGSDR